MYKKIVKLLMLVPLLLIVIQCSDDDDDEINTLVFNQYKVNITPQSVFSLNDTIWINGRVSPKAYDRAINDSVFSTANRGNYFSIYKFIEPTGISNAEGAISEFQFFLDAGEYSFFPSCENTKIKATTELDASGSLRTYRIGLKPKVTGDYFINWENSNLENLHKNKFITYGYFDQVRYDRCGAISWFSIEDSRKEYFFRVE